MLCTMLQTTPETKQPCLATAAGSGHDKTDDKKNDNEDGLEDGHTGISDTRSDAECDAPSDMPNDAQGRSLDGTHGLRTI